VSQLYILSLMALFKIFKDKTGKYKFFLKSNNNQIIFTSKGYSSKLICFNHILLIKKFSLRDDKYERHISDNNPYFTFKIFKNEVVGVSEYFMNQKRMENFITLIKNIAYKADIDRITYSM